MSKQVHYVVVVQVDEDGTPEGTQVDLEMSLSTTHFPYGNVWDLENEEWDSLSDEEWDAGEAYLSKVLATGSG